MNAAPKFLLPPPNPSIDSLTNLSPQGGASYGSPLAPLLVLTRFGAHKPLNKHEGHRVTPFWHNDAPDRVTVTFGRGRGDMATAVDEAAGRQILASKMISANFRWLCSLLRVMLFDAA